MRSIIGTAPGLPRTLAPFNSPALVRLLVQWASAGQAAPATPLDARASLAERLGPWLDWTDAITLSAALTQADVSTDPSPAPTTAAPAQLVAWVMAEQMRLVRSDPVYLQGGDGAHTSDHTSEHTADHTAHDRANCAADLGAYRRACQARQRAMAGACSALREQLRSALASTSPSLARLATLDATLEAALAERERHVLGGVVARIEQRFLQLRQAAAPGWRASFHHDMQQALLAELDLRLLPSRGLLDAMTGAMTDLPAPTPAQAQPA